MLYCSLTPSCAYWQILPSLGWLRAAGGAVTEWNPLFSGDAELQREFLLAQQQGRQSPALSSASGSASSHTELRAAPSRCLCTCGWLIWRSFSPHWQKGVERAIRLLSDVSMKWLKSLCGRNGALQIFLLFWKALPHGALRFGGICPGLHVGIIVFKKGSLDVWFRLQNGGWMFPSNYTNQMWFGV